MNDRPLVQIIEIVQRYVHQYYPDALLVLLCGSWAKQCAHQNSDIDLFIVDAKLEDLLFEGLIFDGRLIEVCALSPQRVAELFAASAHNRSAPVPHQVVDGMLILGLPAYAEEVKTLAQRTLNQGPSPLDEREMLDLRWSLTALLHDFAHVDTSEIPALAAQCHTQVAQAAIGTVRGWRGDRKTLRRSLIQAVPNLAEQLDSALVEAIHGNRKPMLTIGYQVLEKLGGSQRTYRERY